MKTITVARHGEAEANRLGLLAGARTDSPLTEGGRSHAHELSKLVADKDVQLVVTSPLSRAAETAEIVADDIGHTEGVVTERLFIERDFGSATNMPKAEAFAALDNGTATDAEAIPDFADRAMRAIDWLRRRPEERILVVTHAGFAQMLGTVATGGDPKDFLSFSNLSNGGVFELTLE